MANPIVILGWTADDKVPGFYGETKFGQGRVSVGSFPVKCLITGTKTSDGSMTADSDIEPIISLDDAAAKLGARSAGGQQARAALAIEGVNLWAAPPSEDGSATAATITVEIGGSWSTAGTLKFRLDGRQISVGVAATGETASDVESNIADAVNEWTDGPFTAAATTDCVLTCASKGTGGNLYALYYDSSEAPSGITVTISTSSGTGTETVADIIALLKTETFDYIAPAQVDATNLGLFEAHMSTEAGPTIGHLEHMIAGAIGSLVATQSITQTTLNDARSTVMWMLNGETHPAEIAANVAALRSVIEPQNPNFNYDDYELPYIAPQVFRSSIPQHATLKSALNTGISPLKTENGVVKICRGIVTRCLSGASPTYTTYDWGDAVVPDRIRKEIASTWTVFKAANPYIGRDPVGSEKAQPEGVGTPSLWAAEIYKVLAAAQDNLWVQDIDSNLPQVVLDTSRKALIAAVPTIVRWQQHSTGLSVRQSAAA